MSNNRIDPDFFPESQQTVTERLAQITQNYLDENHVNIKLNLDKIYQELGKEDPSQKSSFDNDNSIDNSSIII